jgi:ribulose-5-phosphate 4-epimerase/fuculose-1-phosphate aldolase
MAIARTRPHMGAVIHSHKTNLWLIGAIALFIPLALWALRWL